jgi:hypothetical protein
MNRYFDRTVVINLQRRPDRRSQILDEFKKGWPFADPTFFNAIDGRKLMCPVGFNEGNFAWACFQSFRRVVELAVNDGIESLLILEDDAVLCENFSEKASAFMADVPEDWDFVWFGGHHMNTPKFVKPGYMQSVHMDRNHGFGVRGKALKELYRYWHQWHVGHCDWAISQWVSRWRSYCPEGDWLIGQRGGWSDIKFQNKPQEWWNASGYVPPPIPNPIRSGMPFVPGRRQFVGKIIPGVVIMEGVGREVEKILKSFGVAMPICGECRLWIDRMNKWGPDGCEQNREEILKRLRQHAVALNIRDKLRMGIGAFYTGFWRKVRWYDPAPGILDEAIRIVKERESKIVTDQDFVSSMLTKAGVPIELAEK